MVYIGSLQLLRKQVADINVLLPGYRLFEQGEVRRVNPAERASEIIDFHEERCANILNILGSKVLSLDAIAVDLFPQRLREGYGKNFSQREVMSHLELMAVHGDIEWVDGNSFKSRHTSSRNYKKFFEKSEQGLIASAAEHSARY